VADIFRVVTGTSPTSGTQDYTHTDITSIDAAIILATDSSSDADSDNWGYGVGFWDGTDGVSFSQRHPHSSTNNPGMSGSTATDDYVVRVCPDATAVDTNIRTATCAAATGSDGVTLSWNTNAVTSLYVTVILIQLDSGAVKCGMEDKNATVTGTTTVTTTGVNPNAVFFIHTPTPIASVDNAFSTGSLSFGIACDDGASGIDQGCVGHKPQYITSLLQSALRADNTKCGNSINNNGTTLSEISCTNLGTGNFEVTNDKQATAYAFGYLALQLTDTPKIAFSTTPTDGAEYDPYTDTQQRDAVIGIVSAGAAVNTGYSSGADTAGHGYYVVDSTGTQSGAFCATEDAVTPSNCSNRHSAALIIQGSTAGTPDLTASSPTFDDTGLVFSAANVSTATNAHQVLFIGLGAAANPINETVYPFTGPWR
jgi:hypothetical protein